jgi:hypothetical protein
MVRYLRETAEGKKFRLQVFAIEVLVGATLAAVSYDLTPEGPGRMLMVFFCGLFSREILSVTQKLIPEIISKVISSRFGLADTQKESSRE